MLQVQDPGAGPILESHGKLVRHDFLIAVGRFDAQLVELQELYGVGGVVVVRRQIRLELARPSDATQLKGEGAAAFRGHRDSALVENMSLMGSVRRRCRQHMVLPWWRRERRGIFSWPRDFLAASFFLCGRRTRQVVPWGHVPGHQDSVLGQRWWSRFAGHAARSWQRTR